jgi:CHASE2 domain-containing sensor protein
MVAVEQSWGLWILFKTRGPVAPPDDVIVIGIDEASGPGLNAPIERSQHADLLEVLQRGGASIIVFDLFLHTETPNDEDFAVAIGEAKNVILTAQIERDSVSGLDVQVLRTPIRAFASRAVGSAPSLVPEVFRVDWIFLRDDSDRPTMPLLAHQAYMFERFIARRTAVRTSSTGAHSTGL